MAEGQELRIRRHFEEVHTLRDVAQEAAIAAVAILSASVRGKSGD